MLSDQSKSRSSSIGISDAEITPELSLNSSRDVSISLGEHKPIRILTPIHEREKSKIGVETGEHLFPKPEHR